MSDLLPLVAAALRDKVAVEANEEISQLKAKLRQAHSVEVIQQSNSDAGENAMVDDDDAIEQDIVLASGVFEEGQYCDNPNLWAVPFLKPPPAERHTCYLRELRSCVVCVGGGFPVVTFDDQEPNSAGHEGFLNGNDDPTDSACFIQFCFCPKSTWLFACIHGWPREEWEGLEFPDSDEAIQYLVETVATSHPNATIEFLDVSFVVEHLHGRLRKSLPPPPVIDARLETVAAVLRQVGNTQGPTAFENTCDDIIELMDQYEGLQEVTDENRNLIRGFAVIYHRHGPERLVRMVADANENGGGGGQS